MTRDPGKMPGAGLICPLARGMPPTAGSRQPLSARDKSLSPAPGLCQAACVLELGILWSVSAAAWLYLLLAHGGYWLTNRRLPAADSAVRGDPDAFDGGWPAVVAVVPARNEADMLPVTLSALLGQEYPGEFRVFLVDDGSDDGTGQLARELGVKAARDGGAALTVVTGSPRPDGWAGKVWAMNQGLVAAERAGQPAYVLFTDADIAWAPGALRRLVAGGRRDGRDLVSQMALLRAETAWERMIVPAFVYFFGQLYPFSRVNSPSSKTAAGAGGCMLINRAALAKAGGLELIRGALIDDVALATLLKRGGSRCWLGLTTEVTS